MDKLWIAARPCIYFLLFHRIFSRGEVVGPGTIRREETSFADFKWNLTTLFDETLPGSSFTMTKWNPSRTDFLTLVSGEPPDCSSPFTGVSCITDRYQIGFHITDIRTDNATRYSIIIQYSIVGPYDANADALLYVLQSPTTPDISGNEPALVGDDLSLSCSSESQSEPALYNNFSIIEYSWSGDYTGGDQTLVIGPLNKTDNEKSVTCTANEQGASDGLQVQTNARIAVHFAPTSVILSTNSTTTVVEGLEGLEMTCSVPTDGQGSPSTYSYYWQDPASSATWVNTTDSVRLIDVNTLNVTQHHGTWQCTAGNIIGNSTSDDVTVTVEALPSVLQDLAADVPIVVDDSLSVVCSFRAIPEATITWIGPSGGPDPTVLRITNGTDSTGTYDVTTSTMTWLNENLEKRKTVSGDYTCRANNIHGDATSQTMNLNVLYAPDNVTLTVNDDTVTEAMHDLILTCTVPGGDAGNPDVYSYYWMYPHSTDWVNTTSSVITIDSSTLNATLHDGTWQCKAGNIVGITTAKCTSVLVYAYPSIVQQPDSVTILIDQPLLVTCGVHAKPEAVISWTYNTNNSPYESALNITGSAMPDGPYTISTSTITWQEDAGYDKKKTVSGTYMCTGTNEAGVKPANGIDIDIHYWPLDIAVSSDKHDVIENTDPVNITCLADCNPDCGYIWTDANGTVVSMNHVLYLDKPDRYQAGEYTCTASNTYGLLSASATINVMYVPSIQTSPSEAVILEGDSVTMTCTVDSNPLSDITLTNMTDMAVLDTADGATRLEYPIVDAQCLYTGNYKFTASNSIPDGTYSVEKTVQLDVRCRPRQTDQYPDTSVQGVPIAISYNLTVSIMSNPPPNVTTWTFVDYNGTLYGDLPDNVYAYTQPAPERLTMEAVLNITNTQDGNYGNYSMMSANDYGAMTVNFTILPRSAPYPSTKPLAEDMTAVSITISWTAGFNGGSEQTLWVVYHEEGTIGEHQVEVNTTGVSNGDVVTYKLKDKDTILPDTSYVIWIRAENDFDGGSKTDGTTNTIKTLVLAEFINDPDITVHNHSATIHFDISGPLTHVLETNCVTGSTTCVTANITVPVNLNKLTRPDIHTLSMRHIIPHQHTRLGPRTAGNHGARLDDLGIPQGQTKDIAFPHQKTLLAETRNFTAEVPLADHTETSFVFSFKLYDGEDLLVTTAETAPQDKQPQEVDNEINIGAIVGCVLGILLAVIIAGTFVVLWRKGIFPKHKDERRATQSILDNRAATDQGIQGVDNPYDLETIDPYDTSDGIRAPTRTPDARQGQGVVGPLTGEVYATVVKPKPPGAAAAATALGSEPMYSVVNKPKLPSRNTMNSQTVGATASTSGTRGATASASTNVPLEEMYAKVDKKRKLAGGPPPPPTSPPPAPTSPPPDQASTSQPPQPAPRSKMDRMKGLFKKTPKQRADNEQQYANIDAKSFNQDRPKKHKGKSDVIYTEHENVYVNSEDIVMKFKQLASLGDVDYAELTIVGTEPESDEIRGQENVSIYSSLNFRKMFGKLYDKYGK